MSLTREQALNAREFHVGQCTRTVGPRGGVTTHSEVWRRNGGTKTWVTRPDEYSIPIKYGMGYGRRGYNYITQDQAQHWHCAEDCPLHDPNYVTLDQRPVATHH